MVNGWQGPVTLVAPSMIHLCPAACETVQGEVEAELSVAFACEVLIPELW